MEINKEQAIQQLELLGYSDGEKVFYRSIPGKGFDGSTQNRSLVFPAVPKLQNGERGLYFVVNGGGNKDQDVKQCRAAFCEWDDRPLEEQETLWESKGFLRPSFQVKTRKSIHCYWVLDQPIPPEVWKPIQETLLNALNGDRTLKNPSRVLRLAGAWHVKKGEEPIQCELINVTGERFTLTQIEQALETLAAPPLPFDPDPTPPPSLKTATIETRIVPPIPLERCLPKRDRQLILEGAGSGSRNHTGYGLAKDLISTENYLQAERISYHNTARDLFWDYCRRCDPQDWPEREWEQVWKSAEKDAPANPPLDPDKIGNCLKGWARENGEKLPPTPVLTSKPLAIPQPETARVYGGTKGLNAGELARFVEDNIAHRLGFDDLRCEVLMDGERLTLGNDLKFWFLKQFGEVANKDDIYDCLTYYARQNSFNPVEQYLKGLDCAPIPINDLAARYFGRTEPIYNRMVELWLISCVARALTPLDDPNQSGSQVDHTLILQSGQGKYKSTWFKTLGGKWFSDSVKDIESKDSLMIVHSNWIIELSELDRITSKKQAGAIKHWLTQRTDSFRKPYAREIEPNLPRRCVFCGTVNPERFLVDDENRRFWIVPIADHIPALDIPLLEQERDGIWKAAYLAYASGAVWWPTDEEKGAIALMAQDFKEEDAWQETVEPYLLGKEFVSAAEVLTEALKFEVHQIKRADEMRVNKILDHLGWNKSTRKWDVDPATGKRVQKRVRLSPESKTLQKGWHVGTKQEGQGFEGVPTSNKGCHRLSQENGAMGESVPTCQPHVPTSVEPGSLTGSDLCQPSNLCQPFPKSGNGKQEKPTPETPMEQHPDAGLAGSLINHERLRIGWDTQKMRSVARERYGKDSFFDLSEAEALDFYTYLQTIPDKQ